MYTELVRNITLSADESLIEQARQRALREKTTLNAVFRQWLMHYTSGTRSAPEIREAFAQFDDLSIGRKFTREEMNQRR